MDHELYITRKRNWFDKTPKLDITLEEWTAFVNMDPEMRLDNYSEVHLENGETYQYDNPGAAVWIADQEGTTRARKTTFDFLSGNIAVKNPSPDAFDKMKHIAFKLGAKLQSEEGKVYDLGSLAAFEEISPVATLADAEPGILKKMWWKLQHSLFIGSAKK